MRQLHNIGVSEYGAWAVLSAGTGSRASPRRSETYCWVILAILMVATKQGQDPGRLRRAAILERARVLVVDPHGIVRDGVAALLEKLPRVEVIATAASGAEALSAALSLGPDIITMDILLPDTSGLEATRRILSALPAARILIVTVCQSSWHFVRACGAGVLGYVLKNDAEPELRCAIETVMAGRFYLSKGMREFQLEDASVFREVRRGTVGRLTDRELQVLDLTALGCSSAEAAKCLNISRKTVETYRDRLMSKLGISTHLDLVLFAISNELSPR